MLHSLNYYVAVSALFLKTKEPVLKFATISWLVIIRRKDPGMKSPFPVFFTFSHVSTKALFHMLLSLKKEMSALSLVKALFRVSASLEEPKVNKRLATKSNHF